MANAGTVEIDFAAETAKFTAELKKVRASVQSIEGSFKTLERAGSLAMRFFAGGAIAAYARNAFEAASATATAAQRAGIAVESFSRLQYAARQTDTEMGALTAGIQRLQIVMSDAASGSKAAQATLAQFGLTVGDLANLNVEQQLGRIADEFIKLKDPADRTRLAVDLFGKSAGPALVPLLAQGSEGIRQFTEYADKAGITLTEKTAEGIGAADKALKEFLATAQSQTANFLGTVILGFKELKTAIAGAADDDVAGLQKELNADLDRRRALLQEIERLQARLARGNDPGTFISGAVRVANKELAELETRIAETNQRLLTLGARAAAAEVAAAITPPPSLVEEVDLEAIRAMKIEVDEYAEAVRKLYEEVARIKRERFDESISLVDKNYVEANADVEAEISANIQRELERRNRAASDARNRQYQAEVETQSAIGAVREGFVDSGIDALRTFSGQSEKAAKALVAINKAQAIAQAVQNTAVAVTKAYSQGGAYGVALAAGVAALGAAQIALIARSGYGQVQQINASGGAPIGSPVNPVYTESASAGDEAATDERGVVQVVINGNYFGSKETIDYLIEAFRDEINTKDVVLFSPNSRQAQELATP